MRLAAVGSSAPRRRECDSVALVDVTRHDNRVDVGLSANGRCVSELRGHQTHRHGNVSFRLTLITRGAELRKYGGSTQRSAPGSEVFCAESGPEAIMDIGVDVACGQVAPGAVRVAIAKESRARCVELACNELCELAADHHLTLLLVAL